MDTLFYEIGEKQKDPTLQYKNYLWYRLYIEQNWAQRIGHSAK